MFRSSLTFSVSYTLPPPPFCTCSPSVFSSTILPVLFLISFPVPSFLPSIIPFLMADPSGPGEGELAAAHYQQAVKLKPAHYVAMVNLGRLLRSSNENKEAESWYKRWVKSHNLAAASGCRAADEWMTSVQTDKTKKKKRITGCYCSLIFHSVHKGSGGHEQNFQTEKEHYYTSKSPSNHMGNKIVMKHNHISKSVCIMRKFTL